MLATKRLQRAGNARLCSSRTAVPKYTLVKGVVADRLLGHEEECRVHREHLLQRVQHQLRHIDRVLGQDLGWQKRTRMLGRNVLGTRLQVHVGAGPRKIRARKDDAASAGIDQLARSEEALVYRLDVLWISARKRGRRRGEQSRDEGHH